uniref:Tungsten-containing aldehyde ferredoxin oxidoreductase n=1 Tax=Candidatus Methanogaster sp. ANME-2c ERB4 TaxID=2759911 RepID=A0A7G9YG24_9EURY|nr:tungsten-containing aldehyde ferredoxin oxidoreductase [Methanosarcinales archaeon ANME-2c ERB4]
MSAKIHGWTGNIATIDLDCGTVRREKLPTEVARDFLGGRGLGASILCEMTDPKADAFDAPLILAVGPLTGIAPMSGRHSFVTKSPLTGTIVDSSGGGWFGSELKRAGFDAVVISGQAETPVYLSIDDHDVCIKDASELWGSNVRETTKRLEGHGKVACIGRAGEKCVRFANIMNDYVHACGRGGIGAVMGHKRLKAIVVRGSTKLSIADEMGFEAANKEILRLLRASPPLKSLSVYGTPSLVSLINYLGLMPTKNFRDVRFDVESISGDYIEENYELKRRSCHKCSVACKHRTKEDIEIPEYETIAMFGPDCDNSDFDKIMDANRVCNDYGMDTISCGSTIACHQELHGKTHGLSELASMIGEREGVGDELSTGSRAYADAAGAGNVSMHSKGMEIPGYDPRGALGQSLAYATSNRGACHTRAYMIAPEVIGKPKLIDRQTFAGKAGLVSIFQNLSAAMDSLAVCRFSSFALSAEEYSSILSAVTGIQYTSEDLLRVGERIWNLERIFNLRAGFTRADDSLPTRFFGDGGIDHGEFEDALYEYYRFRGWGMDGVPAGWKLEELGLRPDW